MVVDPISIDCIIIGLKFPKTWSLIGLKKVLNRFSKTRGHPRNSDRSLPYVEIENQEAPPTLKPNPVDEPFCGLWDLQMVTLWLHMLLDMRCWFIYLQRTF